MLILKVIDEVHQLMHMEYKYLMIQHYRYQSKDLCVYLKLNRHIHHLKNKAMKLELLERECHHNHKLLKDKKKIPAILAQKHH